MRHIRLEQALDVARHIRGLDLGIDLAADRWLVGEAATDEDVVAVDGVAILVDGDAGADQPDITDIVLRTTVLCSRSREC